jgi:hypothetical protein
MAAQGGRLDSAQQGCAEFRSNQRVDRVTARPSLALLPF